MIFPHREIFFSGFVYWGIHLWLINGAMKVTELRKFNANKITRACTPNLCTAESIR